MDEMCKTVPMETGWALSYVIIFSLLLIIVTYLALTHITGSYTDKILVRKLDHIDTIMLNRFNKLESCLIGVRENMCKSFDLNMNNIFSFLDKIKAEQTETLSRLIISEIVDLSNSLSYLKMTIRNIQEKMQEFLKHLERDPKKIRVNHICIEIKESLLKLEKLLDHVSKNLKINQNYLISNGNETRCLSRMQQEKFTCLEKSLKHNDSSSEFKQHFHSIGQKLVRLEESISSPYCREIEKSDDGENLIDSIFREIHEKEKQQEIISELF